MPKRIIIRMEVPDEDIDERDPTGVTAELFNLIFSALSPYGDDIDIEPDY